MRGINLLTFNQLHLINKIKPDVMMAWPIHDYNWHSFSSLLVDKDFKLKKYCCKKKRSQEVLLMSSIYRSNLFIFLKKLIIHTYKRTFDEFSGTNFYRISLSMLLQSDYRQNEWPYNKLFLIAIHITCSHMFHELPKLINKLKQDLPWPGVHV